MIYANDVRAIDVRDANALQQFVELLVEYECSLPIDLRHGSQPDPASVREAYDRPHGGFLAYIGDVGAGCVATIRLDESTAIIQRLYVKPAYRQRGIARALVVAALDFCRERGYQRVVLDTEKERLSAAYSLYASLGFKDCAPYGPVTYQNPTFMELRCG